MDPFAYNEYRKEKIEKLLEEGTAKRIKLRKASRQLPRVNKTLVGHIQICCVLEL